jgi:hypothetical protein
VNVSAAKDGEAPTIKMRSTIGTSQPRLHIRIEGAKAKIAQLRDGGASGQRALKLERVHQALTWATAALENPHANFVEVATDADIAAIRTIAALVRKGATAAPMAAEPEPEPMAAAPAPAPTVMQLSHLQSNWMCDDEEKEGSDPSSGQYSDSSCNGEDGSTAQDEPEEKEEDAPVSGLQSVAAWEGAAGMLLSPSYFALESPVLSDEDEMVGLDLAAVDSAPDIGTLCDSVEQATELGSVVTAAAAAEFLPRIVPPDSPLLFLEQDEPFDSGLAAVDCATVHGAVFDAASPLPLSNSTAGTSDDDDDAYINDFDTTMEDDEGHA